tara:strand:- start:17086 stop:18105 length:1020 start_codon:yes stop_codon:yes gene_type:complete
MSKRFLVTGSAGFIGFHLCKRLIEEGFNVAGLDNLNSYYDVNLKKARLFELENLSKELNINFSFHKLNLEDKNSVSDLFDRFQPNYVINLAAQAGVRYSIENPSQYINSNIVGFGNLLEISKDKQIEHFIYASSSSVYGGNTKLPFSEKDPVDNPVSIYAASKKSNELMAFTYSHLYNLPTTGARFFTVYGPWGRPDMAPMIFSKAIISKSPIKVFNHGEMLRDFTYIDDVIESLIRLINIPPKKFKIDKSNKNKLSVTPSRVINIGNGNPISLMRFIEILENELGIKANKIYMNMQLGDVKKTHADTTLIEKITGYKPKTDLSNGIKYFAEWYKKYYF